MVASRIIRGNKSEQTDILFLGDSPGLHDVTTGEAFTGPSGNYLDNILERRPFLGRNIVLDYVYAHPVAGGKGSPCLEQYESCRTRTHFLVHRYRPRVICLIGPNALTAFGISGKITTVCGEVYQYGYVNDSGHAYLVPCLPPALILRDKSFAWMMQMAMEKVGSLVDAEERYNEDCTIEYPERFDRADASGWTWHLEQSQGRLTAIDLETTGVDPQEDRILCVSITYRNDVGNLVTVWNSDCDRDQIASWFGHGPRIIQGAKFELNWIVPPGRPVYHDTFLRAGFINENEPHNLNHLAIRYAEAWPYWADLPPYKEWDELTSPLVPNHMVYKFLEKVGTYCALDTTFTYKLWEYQETRLTDKNKDFLKKVINPLAYILLEMEHAGVKIDVRRLKKLKKDTQARIDELKEKLEQSFPGVNWNSSPQVRKLLFETMGLTPTEFTKAGAPSANKGVIEQLSKSHKALLPIVEYRNLSSKMGRVINTFLEKMDGGAFIHTNYNQGYVVTGRLSSSDPNMQNMQRDGEEKTCIISRFPKGKLVKADYGQFELRISAIQARDRAFQKAVKQGIDLHTDTAQKLKIERQMAKTVNLSLASGTSAMGMHYNEGLPLGMCKRFHKEWFVQHPDIARFHKQLVRDVKTKHYVENIFGRKRRLPESYNQTASSQRRASNQAKNFPIQGGGADIIAAAIVKVDKEFRKRKMKSLLVLQIHDEIVVDSPSDEVKIAAKILRESMMRPFGKDFFIPLEVDIEIGRSLAK